MTSYRFLVKYGPKSSDLELVEFTLSSSETNGPEAMLRDALATRFHDYGNDEFEVWTLGAPVVYEARTSVNVRARK